MIDRVCVQGLVGFSAQGLHVFKLRGRVWFLGFDFKANMCILHWF